ncbi:hypothetical protein CJU89_6964 [Yarrowia sp. B02]|nr:hypothetical protein CJU89_6964 [Yarrowia sp. B02]
MENIPPVEPEEKKRTRGPELTEYQRGIIVGMHKAGASTAEIVETTGHSRSAIRHTLKMDLVRVGGKSLPRQGRARTYTEKDRRRMVLNLKKFPDMRPQQRRDETGVKMSDSTIKRIAKEENIVIR